MDHRPTTELLPPYSDPSVEKDHDGTAGKLELLETALNAQSARVSLVWITVTTVGIYLLSTLGAISDRHRLLLSQIKLPIVSIDIDVKYFLFGSPIVFSILYIYVLYKTIILVGTLRNYEYLLNRKHRPAWALNTYWHRLDIFFVTRLFGPGRTGHRMTAGLMLAAFSCGMIFAPLAVLSIFFVSSLPMRVTMITVGQVMALAFSIGLLSLTLWVLHTHAIDCGRRSLGRGLKWLGIISIIAVLFLLALIWFLRSGDGLRVAGVVVQAAAGQEIDLRDRDLRYADLSDAQLSGLSLDRADLSGAILTGANLSKARMRKATLNGAQLIGANLTETDLTGAKLIDAKLEGIAGDGILLNAANLSKADLSKASLYGARMLFSILDGVTLDSAQLNMALLDYSDLSVDTLETVTFTAVSCRFCALRIKTLAKRSIDVLEEADLYGASLLMGANGSGARCRLATDPMPRQARKGWSNDLPQLNPKVYMAHGVNGVGNLQQWIQDHWSPLEPLQNCTEAPLAFPPQDRKRLGRDIVAEACHRDTHAPHEARAALLRMRRHELLFGPPGFDEDEVLRKLLDPAGCPGVGSLTVKDRDMLQRYAGKAASSKMP